MSQKIKYPEKQVVFDNDELNKDQTYDIFDESRIDSVKLDAEPIMLGGITFFMGRLASKITYPHEATDNNISGTVILELKVDEEGKLIEVKVVESVGGGCDEEAIRVIKEIAPEWFPVFYNDKVVEFFVLIPIRFKLA